VPQTTPLNPQQQWMYRHRRGLRIACAVFLVSLVGLAIYSLAKHHVIEGVLLLLSSGSPLGLILNTRSLERTVAIRDGRAEDS